jgi:hypothetical protein
LGKEKQRERNMRVTVKFSAMPEIVSIFEGEKEIQIYFAGNTARDLLDTLFLKIGAKENPLFLNDQGEISPRLKVNVNGRWISDSNRLSNKLREHDVVELALAPAA